MRVLHTDVISYIHAHYDHPGSRCIACMQNTLTLRLSNLFCMPVWDRGRTSGSAIVVWISLNTLSIWFTCSSKVEVSKATLSKKPFHVSSPACRLLILCVIAACSMRIDVARASSQKWSNLICCSWRFSAWDSPVGTLSSRDYWNKRNTVKSLFIPCLTRDIRTITM